MKFEISELESDEIRILFAFFDKFKRFLLIDIWFEEYFFSLSDKK